MEAGISAVRKVNMHHFSSFLEIMLAYCKYSINSCPEFDERIVCLGVQGLVSRFIVLAGGCPIIQHHVLKRLSLPVVCFFVKDQLIICIRWLLFSVPSTCLFFCQYNIVLIALPL